jgi:hypothetical protein
MSVLTDLVLELLDSGIGPTTDRGLVATFTAGSLAFVCLSVWLLMTSPDPLRQPAWGIGVYVGSILVGAGGSFGVSAASASKPVGPDARPIVFDS